MSLVFWTVRRSISGWLIGILRTYVGTWPDRQCRPERCGGRSEEPVLRVVHAAQAVVVDHGAGDAAVLGEHPRLRLDQLSGEDAADRALGGQQRLPVEQLEVPRQLLDAVDLAAALDLDGHGQAAG